VARGVVRSCQCALCGSGIKHRDLEYHRQMNVLLSRLDEQQRRWYLAVESQRHHFFPRGKEQLAEQVIHRSGRMYLELWETVFDAAPDPAVGMRDFFVGAAEVLRQTDYADACPIATVALEVASSSEPLRRATAEVFESWIGSVSSRASAMVAPASTSRAVPKGSEA